MSEKKPTKDTTAKRTTSSTSSKTQKTSSTAKKPTSSTQSTTTSSAKGRSTSSTQGKSTSSTQSTTKRTNTSSQKTGTDRKVQDKITQEEFEKRKTKEKRKRRKKSAAIRSTILYIAFILLSSICLSYIAIYASNDVFAFVKEDKAISITIPKDTTSTQLGKMLEESGVVRYGTLFSIFMNLTADDINDDGESIYVQGVHDLNSNMDYRGIADALQKRTAASLETVNVTIPEGYTIEQIGVILEENEVISLEDYYDTIENYPFKHDFLTQNDGVLYQLEGYLFPDTYQFYKNDNAVSVVNKMLNNFNDKIFEEIEEKAEELGLTIHQVATIASLIEREAAVQVEQVTISGVIHNRLNNSSEYPFLNIDATIQYVVGQKDALTYADLRVDSPYNTYTEIGLPPGPIANPGYNTLLAAVSPENHGYYFYVATTDGYHKFTKNLAEHNVAVEESKKLNS